MADEIDECAEVVDVDEPEPEPEREAREPAGESDAAAGEEQPDDGEQDDAPGLYAGPGHRPDAYRLIRLLGTGGESEVWLARPAGDVAGAGWPARVALKLFAGGQRGETDEGWLARFRLAALLANPAVAELYEAFAGRKPHPRGQPGEGPARRYLALEYVHGPTLADWVHEHGDAPFHERIVLLRTLAYGIDTMHEGEHAPGPMVHGDIKPDNVRLAADGAVKLIDPGYMVSGRHTARAGISAGYAAPELYDGQLATISSDRFAFAATVFFVLTGAAPPISGGSQPRPLDSQVREALRAHGLAGGRKELADGVLAGLSSIPGRRPTCRAITECVPVTDPAPETDARPRVTGPPPGSRTMPGPSQPPPRRSRAARDSRYLSSLWPLSDVAAPVLAAAAIVVALLVNGGVLAVAHRAFAAAGLLAAAGALAFAARCGWQARLHVHPGDLATSYRGRQYADTDPEIVWAFRCRLSFSAGLALLFAAVAVSVLPRGGHPAGWAACGIAAALALVEVGWLVRTARS